MSPINILCSTDDRYAPWCGIMLTSLFETNPEERFVVYILSTGLEPENVSSFNALQQKYKAVFRFVHIDETLLHGCSIREGDTISVATYFRLLAPGFIPEDVEKVLYLDVDIIVNGPVRPFWETDLEGYAFAAVMDESFYQEDLYRRLDFPRSYGYVNAGVLLMNLAYWRENGCVKRCMDFVRENQQSLYFYDQDALNKILHAEKKLVSVRYNFQHGFLLWWQYGYYEGALKEDIDASAFNPVVIHFDGRSKPWHKDSHHPYTSYFLHYKSISLWKDVPLVGEYTVKERFRWFGYNLMAFLGFRHSLFRIKAQKFNQ